MHLHDGLLLLSYLIEMNASDLTLQAIRNQAQKVGAEEILYYLSIY